MKNFFVFVGIAVTLTFISYRTSIDLLNEIKQVNDQLSSLELNVERQQLLTNHIPFIEKCMLENWLDTVAVEQLLFVNQLMQLDSCELENFINLTNE